MPRFYLFCFGSPRIECDGREIKLGTRKALALLIYLAITRQAHRRDFLVNLLWPESSQSGGRALLRGALHDLRQALDVHFAEADRETVAINPGFGLWVDVARLNDLLDECRAHKHDSGIVCTDCGGLLAEACELYRGNFLAGFSLKDGENFDAWESSQTQYLLSNMDFAYERLIGRLGAEREWDKAIVCARRWLEMDRTNEAAHRLMMELYARSGQRMAALSHYEHCRIVLEQELGLSPDQVTVRLYDAIKENRIESDERSTWDAGEVTLTNLPRHLTSFVGREREIAEIKQLLPRTCLLTIAGSGGCGKTRLAVQVASDLMGTYADGIWFVGLESLADPMDVERAVAVVFGIHGPPDDPLQHLLSAYLGSKNLLLVLDGCEHLTSACAAVVDALLRGCPFLTILITSREPLNITGEITWRVPSLTCPDAQRVEPPGPAELLQHDATRLFLVRATASAPDFRATPQNAPCIAHICRRLDGIPLAVELAASKLKVLSVEQILVRLEKHFSLLEGGSSTAPPRHQTLRATMEWSHELLSCKEQTLVHRLSVFSGGWTLEASEVVCSDRSQRGTATEIATSEVLNLHAQLVNKSIAHLEEKEGRSRYRMLETTRQFAGQKLVEENQDVLIRRNHADFFLAFTERADAELGRGNQVEWLSRLEDEGGNIVAALQYFHQEADVFSASRLAGAVLRAFSRLSISYSSDIPAPEPSGRKAANAGAGG